ncbi:MAG: phenylalanine--tRNA ligase subunit beta [Clostridiales bacterium]|nr:phenylalanine--tRNA ligase subunit beta [Clostridiales bacterium]
MFVSMNWIKEYVDLSGCNIEDLIHRFTLSTAEVEDIIYKGRDISGVVVGEILSVENHPDSKKLHLLKVDIGTKICDCVCGAPNVAAGQKVAFATAGGRVPGGEIGKCKIAGYDSEGMCCSEKELGISDDHSGLMILDASLPNGADLKSLYEIEDVIFEVDNKSLTNRPDLWGHYGIAREFAALTGKTLKPLDLADLCYEGNESVRVSVKREDLVYRYSCLKMDNITRTVSPVNVRIRLFYCGMRSINLLADLTNYIMLELGQPTHAFDAHKIHHIVVDTPKNEMSFTTLDGTERKIEPNTLMIWDEDQPVAIAGIMGGLDSEIVDNTTSVVLESANFDGVSVRKSSSALGLRTDASMRYEKILDPELTLMAVKRFVRLVQQADTGAKIASCLTDVYVQKYPEISLSFDKAYVDRYTGIDISEDQICQTLRSLGFDVTYADGKFTVGVPSWRATKDVTIKADIIEEITRIYGYDNFAISTTRSKLHPVKSTTARTEENALKDILVQKYGLHEVHSYIWCDGKKYKRLGIEVEDNVRILNIATPENGTIRNSMLPTLLSFVYDNRGYRDAFGIFEIGRVVDGFEDNGYCKEKRRLGITLFDKQHTEKELYFSAVDMIRCLFAEIKHSEVTFEKMPIVHKWQHPKNTSRILYGGTEIGVLCTLHPQNVAKIDKNAAIVCMEFDLEAMSQAPVAQIAYEEPSKFPSIDIDLSLSVKNGITYHDISQSWKALNAAELKDVNVIDIYESGSTKSITIRLSFSSDERTLAMDEVQPLVDKVLASLESIGVTLRS